MRMQLGRYHHADAEIPRRACFAFEDKGPITINPSAFTQPATGHRYPDLMPQSLVNDGAIAQRGGEGDKNSRLIASATDAPLLPISCSVWLDARR